MRNGAENADQEVTGGRRQGASERGWSVSFHFGALESSEVNVLVQSYRQAELIAKPVFVCEIVSAVLIPPRPPPTHTKCQREVTAIKGLELLSLPG